MAFSVIRAFYRVWLRFAHCDDIDGLRVLDLARGDTRARMLMHAGAG